MSSDDWERYKTNAHTHNARKAYRSWCAGQANVLASYRGDISHQLRVVEDRRIARYLTEARAAISSAERLILLSAQPHHKTDEWFSAMAIRNVVEDVLQELGLVQQSLRGAMEDGGHRQPHFYMCLEESRYASQGANQCRDHLFSLARLNDEI